MHPALEAVRKATLGTPWEGALWLVGGAVRDDLLGLPSEADFDLVLTTGSADLARFLFERRVSSIPPVTYERFGTAMVRVEGASVELVTARRESYDERHRKPAVEPATLEEDAKRRDFTVNTLLRNLHSDELLDPLGEGRRDLEARILRTPLDPAATFHDDPLRMLRAVRFRWKLGFAYAPRLEDALRAEAGRLQIISAERIRDEWLKMLSHPSAPDAMADLMRLGLLDQFAPEFRAMVGVEQGSYHHLDVWDHTLLALRNAGSSDLVLSLSVLLHDVAKPQTRTIDAEGRTRFFGHESEGAAIAADVLRRLRVPLDDVDRVALMVKHHMRLATATDLSPSAARRLLRDLGDELPRLIRLAEADAGALKPGVKTFDANAVRARLAEVEAETPRSQLDSPLNGSEIMDTLKLPAGPEVGKWKRHLTEMVLEGTLAPGDKDSARAEVLRAVADSTAHSPETDPKGQHDV